MVAGLDHAEATGTRRKFWLFLNPVWPAGDTGGEWALNEVREGHSMTSGAGDFHVHRFSSDDVAARDRLAFVREVLGRVIVKHDIEAHVGPTNSIRDRARPARLGDEFA
jgi:hypothetical protein